MVNLNANFDELEKQLATTRNTLSQIEKQKKRGKRNGDIVKGKVYSRKDDLKRDTTEELVRKYKSKRYASK